MIYNIQAYKNPIIGFDVATMQCNAMQCNE